MLTGLAEQLQNIVGDAYELRRELDGGGMSRLFLGTDTALSRDVVIKVLPPEYSSEMSSARFQREIAVSVRLQHPNILSVLNAGSRDGIHYYVMPFVRGESLRALLSKSGALPVDDGMRVLGELANAIDYAHRQGVVHRDIKPENVLLADGHAILADFGVAKALGLPDGDRLTRSGVSVGTLGYMAPEQLAGDHNVGPSADVFSLAAVGYELLTGRAPFAGPTGQQALASYFGSPPPAPHNLNHAVPITASLAILRGLSVNPDARQPSARHFADDVFGRVAPRQTPLRLSRRVAFVISITVFAGLGGLASRIHQRRESADVSDDRVAVAPFEVLGPGMSLWREGLADIIARNVDGAGVLRVISPTRVVRLWPSRGEPGDDAGFVLGQAVHARFVVLGSLLAAGPDSVRVSVRVLDAATKRSLAEAREWRDGAARIDRVADSVSIHVLRVIGSIRPVSAVRRAAFDARSFAALKELLAGEQSYRRSSWDSAEAHFSQALALDSTFALALWRRGLTLSWKRTVSDTLSWSMLLRAGSFNHGLAPRESLLVAADSIRAAITKDERFDSWREIRRLFATLEEAVRQYPSDPETWYALGDAEYHFGYAAANVSERRIFEALFRAIELDSAFAPPYSHTIELALSLFPPDSAQQLARRILSRYGGSKDDEIVGARASLDLLRAKDSAEVWRRLSTLPPSSAATAWLLTRRSRDSLEVAVIAAKFLSRQANTGTAMLLDPLARDRRLLSSMELAYRGHFLAALAELPDAVTRPRAELALNGAVSDSAANRLFEGWLRQRSRLSRYALAWWLAHGDSASIFSMLRNADEKLAMNRSDVQARYDRDAASAYLSLLRRDTVSALHTFAALSDSVCDDCSRDRITQAEILAAKGQTREAIDLISRRPAGLLNLDEITTLAVLAPLLERAGRRAEARQTYQAVADGWRDADPAALAVARNAAAAARRLR